MDSTIQALQAQIDRIQLQTVNTFSFVESGLAHLSRQLENISKHNDATKTIINHLKAVVESNFNHINKQEDDIKATNNKLTQLFSLLKSFAAIVDEKCTSVDTLTSTVQQLVETTKSAQSPVKPEHDNHLGLPFWIFPKTPDLFPEQPPNYDFSAPFTL
jgi:chromosome segregation ATPase